MQMTLDVQAEDLNTREKWIITRLKGYRDLDLEIEGCYTALAADIEPPSTTIRPPDEDDPYVLAKYREPLKETRIQIATTIQKHVPAKWQYVTVERVHKTLQDTYSDDLDEDYAIRDAVDATKGRNEARVELTPTERAVVRHEAMKDRVRHQLVQLKHQKRVMETALGQMSKYYPEWHDLLWRRYVQDEKFAYYLTSTGMSEKLYRNERRRALKQFDKLAIGLM